MISIPSRVRAVVLGCLCVLAGAACAGASTGNDGNGAPLPEVGSPSDPGASSPMSTGSADNVRGIAGSAGVAGGAPVSDPGIPPAEPATTPPAASDPMSQDPGTMLPPTLPLPLAGPEGGDPSKPIVTAGGTACGANPSLFGLTTANAMVGGREVHLAYPCNIHAGAPVTFILNLHGTMAAEELKGYQVAYFSINNHANTHNLIVASPKSVVSQWGNGDNGADLRAIASKSRVIEADNFE